MQRDMLQAHHSTLKILTGYLQMFLFIANFNFENNLILQTFFLNYFRLILYFWQNKLF